MSKDKVLHWWTCQLLLSAKIVAVPLKSIAAVGREAKWCWGAPQKVLLRFARWKTGWLRIFFVTEKMLQYFIKQVHRNNFMRPSPRVLVYVPAGATQVERRAHESAIGAGAREVYLIEEPMAAAIGKTARFNCNRFYGYWWLVVARPKLQWFH